MLHNFSMEAQYFYVGNAHHFAMDFSECDILSVISVKSINSKMILSLSWQFSLHNKHPDDLYLLGHSRSSINNNMPWRHLLLCCSVILNSHFGQTLTLLIH